MKRLYEKKDHLIRRNPNLTDEQKQEVYKEKELNRLKSSFTLNSQTNRYDYDGTLDKDILKNFISEDKDGFTINFGEVTGDFDCSENQLLSLKGAPQEVDGRFDCSHNPNLHSLDGIGEVGGGIIKDF